MIDYVDMILGNFKEDAHETEPGVYQHTFTSIQPTVEDLGTIVENIDLSLKPGEVPTYVISGKMWHRIAMLHAKAMARLRRLERRRKIERRQYRAAFRRRKRGLA